MKYLGIDYGIKRIGIAISDDEGSFAFPQSIIENKKPVEEIIKISSKNNIKNIVIGESISENGQPNQIFNKTKEFARKLENQGFKIHFEPEGFSSVEAYRFQHRKGYKDDSAAAIILQRFLDKQFDNKINDRL